MADKDFKFANGSSGWEVISSVADVLIHPLILMLIISMFLGEYRFRDMESKIAALEKKIESCK